MATLSGDPQEDGGIKDIDEEDVVSLKKNAMLRTKLLDYVLYYVCLQSTMIHDVNHALESIPTPEMIGTWLDPHISDRKLKSYKSFFNNIKVGKH